MKWRLESSHNNWKAEVFRPKKACHQDRQTCWLFPLITREFIINSFRKTKQPIVFIILKFETIADVSERRDVNFDAVGDGYCTTSPCHYMTVPSQPSYSPVLIPVDLFFPPSSSSIKIMIWHNWEEIKQKTFSIKHWNSATAVSIINNEWKTCALHALNFAKGKGKRYTSLIMLQSSFLNINLLSSGLKINWNSNRFQNTSAIVH